MKPIQDRIINSFDKKFFFKTGKLKGFFKPSIDGSNIKQFIIQSIKLVEQETRKETSNEMLDWFNRSVIGYPDAKERFLVSIRRQQINGEIPEGEIKI